VDYPAGLVELVGPKAFGIFNGRYHASIRKQVDPGMKGGVFAAAVPIVVDVVRKHIAAWAEELSVHALSHSSRMSFEVRPVLVYKENAIHNLLCMSVLSNITELLHLEMLISVGESKA
jgi:hypothetical protein